MPETHLPGNPFSTAPAAPPPVARPKHKPGNPFAQPAQELDTFPALPGMEEPKNPFADVSAGHSTNAGTPITGWDPMALQRKVAEAAPEFTRGIAGGATTMLSRVGAGIVRIGSKLSPVVAGGAIDPNDPQLSGITDDKAMATRSKAGEELASTIRKTGLNVANKVAPPLEGPRDLSSLVTGKPAPPTTTQKIARGAGEITGQLAPFVAAGPLGLAAGSGLNIAAEVGAKPEESLLGMFSKEQAQNPWKRGAAALAGDVAIAAPLHYGAQALRNYVRAKTAVSPEELARMGEAIPGAAPAPEVPIPAPVSPARPLSRSGAIGNQPKPALPLKPGPRGPVVDLANYPLSASPAGQAREAPRLRYERTTKGGRGAVRDRSWMDQTPIVDESQLTDKVLSGQQRRLLDVAHEAADASPSGGIVVDPGHKTASSVGDKIARKELGGERPDLSPLQQIGDVNRASIVVDHPNDAGPVIRHLQDAGWVKEVDDKFHKPDALGYGAVHMQLLDPITDQAAELQIHTPQTWAARDTFGGHDIYDYLFSKDPKAIHTPSDQTEARRLIEYNRKLYSEAHDAAMLGKPLPGQDGAYQMRMELDHESPAYGRWYVEERPPAGSPAGAHGPKVAETDNPFKARTMMNELDQKAPTADVPHGNTPQSNVDNVAAGPGGTVPEAPPPLNPFREQHPPAESQLQGPAGHEDVTYFGNRAVRTRYRVVDSHSVIASNNPHTFERRADYPAAIQGRVYHGTAGRGAAEQVVAGAAGLDAPRIVNPNRNIVGPPVVSPDGPAIAGNQRAMMMQRVYDLHPEKAAELKAQIVADAHKVGIDPAEVEKMDRPVLVREVVDPTVNVKDENTLRELNEISDRATVKAKDPLTEAMGRARQLKANSGALEHFAATSSPEEPLSEYLQGPNGLPFLNKLVEDKVISPTELDSFRDASTGKITKQGRQKLSDMMSAAAVGDAGIIDAAPAAIVGKLETGTPRLIAAAQVDGWSLEKPLQEALELHTSKTANGQKSIADALDQPDMMGREVASPEGQQLARFLEKESKPKVTDALRQWSEAADKAKSSDGSADMFGVSAEKPDEAFARIFGGEPLAGATAERNIGARATPMVGGNRRGFVGTPPHILSSLAGDASKDPYNYAAFKMLSSMAGAGVGAAGGGYAGSKLPAGSPEERRRNTAVGLGLGAFAGFMAPFTPEMVEDFAKMLRTAGAEVPAKRFSLNVSPELVRVKIEGRPSQAQMKQLFTAVQKNPDAQFRWSLRDRTGNEVGSGKYLHELAAEMPWADSNRPLRTPETGQSGAVGNQPEPRPGPRPPTRKVRSPYEERDIVYWPRNSRAAVNEARSYLNLSTAGLDKTATARLRTLIASGLDKGTIDKGYRSFAEMDLSTVERKRELLKELVEDPNTLVGRDKLEQIPTDDIKAMWMIAHDNTKTIEAAARVINDPLATEAERLSAAELHDKAYKQTEELLSRIVTGTAQKGRELGALRNIAKQSTDPEVWLVQAKKMMGDRPLPDAVQANIRQLARRAQEACL